jgi:hypothetical protein
MVINYKTNEAMSTIFRFSPLFVLALLFSSCAPRLTPFTQRLYDDYQWSESELRRIQFYLSQDLVLRREFTGGRSEITGGQIKVVEGRDVEEVIIRAGTPGVFLFSPRSNRFAISFDSRDDERYLMFGPNPKVGNRYALLASNWDRREGVVTYGGQKYQVDGSNAYASLMVDLKKIRSVSTRSYQARGRRVGG